MATEFITSSVFIAQNTTGTTVLASGALNQSGTLYSVIVPAASGAPNVQQIIDGQDSASGTLGAGFKDNEANTGSGTYVSLSGYGLTNATAYKIYVAASGTDDGLIAAASGVAFTTYDASAPTWSSGYPYVDSNTGATARLLMAISDDDNCSGWGLNLASGTAAPTAAAIKASGFGFFMQFHDTISAELTFSGLSSETTYDAYFVAQNASETLQATGYLVRYTTDDIIAPTWSGTYPDVVTIYGTSGKFSLAVNEASCSGFVIVLPSGSSAPTSAAIISSGTGAAMALANTVYNVTVTGLTSETDYTAYAVAEDEVPNIQATGYLIGSFTTSDITAPSWTSGWPNVGTITVSTASVNLKLNDAGSGYFVIIPSGDSSPTATQIIAHTDADDVAITAGLYGSGVLVANTQKVLSATSLRYSTYYTACVTAKDDAGNPTATVATYSFRTLVPRPGTPGRYSIRRVTKDRQRLGNQIMNTMRG